MRSIGKIKIKKLNKMIKEEIEIAKKDFCCTDYNIVEDNVKAQIPEDWYDTWEMAYQEINMLISDEISAYAYGEK